MALKVWHRTVGCGNVAARLAGVCVDMIE